MRAGVLLFFCLTIVTTTCVAQTVDISAPTRLGPHISKVKIIGKNNDGYVVRLSGTEELIHVYDRDLKLAVARTLDYKGGDGGLQHILLNKSGASLFYLHSDKKNTELMMQPVNAKFIDQGRPMEIDTFKDKMELVDANLHFKISMDQNYILFYYPVFDDAKVTSMQLTCIDRSATVLYKCQIPINRPEKDMEYAKALVDNTGNGYLIFSAEKDGKDSTFGDEYFVTRTDRYTGKQNSYTIHCDKEIFTEPQFEIDNVNANLIFCGFYDKTGDPNDAAANGFFYLQYGATEGILKQSSYVPFSAAFMYALTGRDLSDKNNRLYTFGIKRILLRIDGGALITAESSIRDRREVINTNANLMNSPYPTYRTVNTFSCNDIIAFSIKPTGDIDWNTVMRKKQISEDDGASNSSFAFANEKDKLHFLYLDEISSSGAANEYVLNSKGISERIILFNQEDKDVFLIPKLGKQVAPNELVIPSIRVGVFRLVRVQY